MLFIQFKSFVMNLVYGQNWSINDISNLRKYIQKVKKNL